MEEEFDLAEGEAHFTGETDEEDASRASPDNAAGRRCGAGERAAIFS